MPGVYGAASPKGGEHLTSPETPATPPAATPSPLADWWTRVVGAIIDGLPILILALLTFWSDFLSLLLWAVAIAYTAYLGHLEGTTGQTPGKAVQGTRLVDSKGEVIGSGAGIGRKFAHILDSICLLGYLLPLVDAKRQTIADKLLETYVVTGVEKKPLAVDLWIPAQQTVE